MHFDIFNKHYRIFLLHTQYILQYRLRSFVWMLVGFLSVSTLLIFWNANLASNPTAYTVSFDEILSYFLLMLVFGNVLISHSEGDIAQIDIYKGELSKYLLKPIPYIVLKFYGEIVWRLMEGFWSILIIAGLFLFGVRLHISTSPQILFLTFVSSVIGLALSYIGTVILGLSAIWLTSTKGLFELYEMSLLLFAGYLMPLSQFSPNFRLIAEYLPFASMVYIPVTIVSGKLSVGESVQWMGIQAIWLLIFYLLYRMLWKRGVKVFTGAGQ
ncbi:MAG: ABC-2 family transporter protein [Candidatus Woesebacteria bacterium]